MRVRLVGASWTRLAPYKAYIPLGPPGSLDSHTTYAARAFPDPKDPDTLLMYYSGGNGPHSGEASFACLLFGSVVDVSRCWRAQGRAMTS